MKFIKAFFGGIFNIVVSIVINGGLIYLMYLQMQHQITPPLHNLMIFILIFYVAINYIANTSKLGFAIYGKKAVESYQQDNSPFAKLAENVASAVLRQSPDKPTTERLSRIAYVESLAANKNWLKRKLLIVYASVCLGTILTFCVLDGYIFTAISLVLSEFMWLVGKVGERENRKAAKLLLAEFKPTTVAEVIAASAGPSIRVDARRVEV